MTNAQRLALLDAAVAGLKLTTKGYAPTKGSGPHWRSAIKSLDALAVDLGRKPTPKPPDPPPAYSGLFASDGVMMRTPDGNAETKARQAVERGYVWVAGNVSDGHRWEDWDPEGGVFIPWARVRSEADVVDLLDEAADAIAPAALVNLEVEAKDSLPPWRVREISDAHRYRGERGLSMEGWLYNSVPQKPGTEDPKRSGWEPLGDWPFLLQAFDRYATEIPALIQHAHDLGVRTAFPTLQAYGQANGRPDRHGWTGPISIFTGDDVIVWP